MPENQNEAGDRITLEYDAASPFARPASPTRPAERLNQTNGSIGRIAAIKKDPLEALLSRGEIFIPTGCNGDLVSLARLAIRSKYIMECESGEQMDKIEKITEQLNEINLTVEIMGSGSALIVIHPYLLEQLNSIFLEARKGTSLPQDRIE